MTPQDQQMIDGLIDRVRTTQITDRDPGAAAHLQQGLGGNPDAIYILAQTVLVQQHSLEQAHAQLDQMESQLTQLRQGAQQPVPQQPDMQPAQRTSWLDRFFGTTSSPPQQTYSQQQPSYNATRAPYQQVNAPLAPFASQQAYPQQAYPQSGYAPAGYPQAPYPPQGYGYGAPQQSWGQATGMGGGSFLRNAAQTAAGVAAGEMLFHGIESMFSGHHEGYGGGRDHENVVNNYYEDRDPSEKEHRGLADTDSSFYNPTHDASHGGTSSTQNFADPGDDTSRASDSFNDSSFDDDSSSDDTSFDDSSSSDSGSDDSGSSDDSSS